MQYRMSNIAVSVVLFASLHADPAHADEARCAEPLATLVSVEGLVETAWQDGDAWRPVSTATRFCPGDRLRVGANSRAAVVLSNHTVMRLDALSTLNFTGPQEQDSLWVELLRGISHFISRVPRRLTVSTPYVNAGVEGTEFLVTADDRESNITVYEGRVNASNPQGSLLLTSGQSATATSGSAPMLRLMIKPRDGLHWALHYPSVVQFSATDAETKDARWQAQVAQSLTKLNQNDRTGALAAVEQLGGDITDARFFTYRASLYMGVGRADAAERDIEQALQLDGANGDALALQAVIALAQNDKDRGLHLAMQAVDKAPRAAGAHLALSYAWQAQFELDLARAAAQEAVKINPHDALAWARLAELHLMFGERDAAIAAAEEAARLDPRLARSQSVLGFAYLNDIRLGDARQAFEQAAMLDPGDPLPRLGLGLIQVREGKLESGRQQMEIAASLDPDDALVRSYLGKAYYEEKRDARAASQFDTAKALDPNDPTPWFYDAILEQSNNRPVEALQDLQTSIALNDNRAVYRSRLLLDEDAAARSASLARIYNNIGFQQLALRSAWRSIDSDLSNYSAHRLLADSYVGMQGQEIVRVSELLQAQLLQPANTLPIQPQLAEITLPVLTSGPASVSFNEFNPLFVRDGIRVVIDGVGGSNGTWGDDVVVSGLNGRYSYSLGQYHYKTDGFRVNNDIEDDIYNLYVQAAVTPSFNLQAELRRRETDSGDLDLNFDPADFSTTDRRNVQQDTVRIGSHYTPTANSDLLVSVIKSKRDSTQLSTPLGADIAGDRSEDGLQSELQYLLRYQTVNVTLGAGLYDTDVKDNEAFDWTNVFGEVCPPDFPCVTNSQFSRKHRNAYAYVNTKFPQQVIWTAGLGYDALRQENADVSRASPKLGVQLLLQPGLQLRAAYFKTLKRALTMEQTLEPTQIAGFNQFFDDPNGTKAARYGVGLDATFARNLHGGVEVSRRSMEVPEFNADSTAFLDRNEQAMRGYLYWTPAAQWAVSLEAQRDRLSQDDPIITDLKTTSVPLSVRYFASNGWFARLTGTHVSQQLTPGVDSTLAESGNEQFVVTGAALGYRLPRRRGIVSLEIDNLFDRQFRYQDTNLLRSQPVPSRFIPERTVMSRFTLNF